MWESGPVRAPHPGQVGEEPLEEVCNRRHPKSTLSARKDRQPGGKAPPCVLPGDLCCPLLAPAAGLRPEEKSETKLL